jgi:hypothetical protein
VTWLFIPSTQLPTLSEHYFFVKSSDQSNTKDPLPVSVQDGRGLKEWPLPLSMSPSWLSFLYRTNSTYHFTTWMRCRHQKKKPPHKLDTVPTNITMTEERGITQPTQGFFWKRLRTAAKRAAELPADLQNKGTWKCHVCGHVCKLPSPWIMKAPRDSGTLATSGASNASTASAECRNSCNKENNLCNCQYSAPCNHSGPCEQCRVYLDFYEYNEVSDDVLGVHLDNSAACRG